MFWRCTPPVRFRGPIINPKTFSDILKLIVWCWRWLKWLLTSDNRVAMRRATGRAVDLGGAKRLSGYFISLKYSKKAAVFKKLSLLMGKPSMSVGGAMPPPPIGRRPWPRRSQVKLTASQRWLKFENKQRASWTALEKTRSKRALAQDDWIVWTAQMAEWYRASVSWAVDSGLIPSRVKPMTLKLLFTASLLDAQH